MLSRVWLGARAPEGEEERGKATTERNEGGTHSRPAQCLGVGLQRETRSHHSIYSTGTSGGNLRPESQLSAISAMNFSCVFCERRRKQLVAAPPPCEMWLRGPRDARSYVPTP